MTVLQADRHAGIALSRSELAAGLAAVRSGSRPGSAWRDLLWAVLLGSAFVWLRGTDIGLRPAPVVAAAALLLAVGSRPAGRWWSHGQAILLMRERPALRAQVTLAWDDGGFTLHTPPGTRKIAWTDVSRWDEGLGMLVFTSAAVGGVFVPKRSVGPAQLADLKAHALRHGVPGPGQSDARPPRDVLAAFEAKAFADPNQENADQAGELAFQIAPDDVRAYAARTIVARLARVQNLAFIALTAVALAGLVWLMQPRDYPLALGLALGAQLALTLFFQVARPLFWLDWSVAQLFRQRRDLTGDVRLRWDAETVRITSEAVDANLAWSAIRRWREGRAAVILEFATGGMQIVPKRALTADELADLRRCARGAGLRGLSGSVDAPAARTPRRARA